MKRRDFILAGLSATAGSVLAASRRSVSVSPPGRKVTVVGAGLSGLVAAYELGKLNFDVLVIEAQKRVGGRVLTLRRFSEGHYAEAGAARIPHNHDLTLKYVREFGLPLAPFYPSDGRFVRFYDGRVEAVDWGKFNQATQFVVNLERPERWQKIKGGNDLLPLAFSDKLARRIRYGSPVVKIEQLTNSARVTFLEDGKPVTIESDLVVCAIPFTMLAKVEIAPALSSAKNEAIRSLKYESASRVFVETRRRFWHDNKLNGFAIGPDFAEIWDSTLGQPGTGGILQTYLRGDYSLELGRLSESERIDKTVADLARFFPELPANRMGGFSKCWSEDPWVHGAWAHLGRQQFGIATEPEGRIHFAGEHLSHNASWMQGALESGQRVVEEVARAPITVR